MTNTIAIHEFNGMNAFQLFDVLTDNERNDIILDIDYEIENHLWTTGPLYQTYSYLHTKYIHKSSWKKLIDKAKFLVDSVLFEKLNQNISLNVDRCWANVFKPESEHLIHNHDSKFSSVFYLKNPSSEYGTRFYFDDWREGIICGKENSLLLFDGSINHEANIPPKEVTKVSPRYSVAMDFS